MIIGIGTDIADISRLATSLERTGEAFLKHVYAPEEMAGCPQKEGPRRLEFLAGRWAAKEAFAKALGTGITGECLMREIVVLNCEGGQPRIQLKGKTAVTAAKRHVSTIHVSISHEKQLAVATVLLEGERGNIEDSRNENMIEDCDCSLADRTAEIGKKLLAKGLHLGTAESCTGGWIAATITAMPGSSEWFDGGIVVYTNDWKQRHLGVKTETLEAYGAVSTQVVQEMLEGLRKRQGVTAGMAVSGIAGPGGGTPAKPVGTVCFGAMVEGNIRTECRHFAGDRQTVRRQSVEACLNLLDELLSEG